jgi:hypothetical protein
MNVVGLISTRDVYGSDDLKMELLIQMGLLSCKFHRQNPTELNSYH